MIGLLPKSLVIDGIEYDIDSDYRTALLIMQMYNDRALSVLNAQMTMLNILFTTIPEGESEPVTIIPENISEAIKQAMWFLNIGDNDDNNGDVKSIKRTIDYKKDEQLLFSAVNAVYTKDVRSERYMHWWTFYGLCQAIDGESLISYIISIRNKLFNGKKLEKYENEFYNQNKDLIIIKGEDTEESVDDIIMSLRNSKNRELEAYNNMS